MDISVFGMMAGIIGLVLGLAAIGISGNLALKLDGLRMQIEELRISFSKLEKRTIRKDS